MSLESLLNDLDDMMVDEGKTTKVMSIQRIQTRDEARDLYNILVKYLQIYHPGTILDFMRRTNNDIGKPRERSNEV